MGNNTQGRKWAITINNPADHGIDTEKLTDIFLQINPTYYCMSEEIGEQGTPHIQAFFCKDAPIRFGRIKKLLPVAHLERAYGTCQANRDYVAKTGKWAQTDKAKTSVPGTFMEWGTMPPENAEGSPKNYKLMQLIQDGLTDKEILDTDAGYAMQIDKIGTLRQTLLCDTYKKDLRPDIDVIYLYGPPGIGKTRSIYAKYPAQDICRITSYPNRQTRFDAYTGQPVLVFEEFSGQVPIRDMLNYLDIYPVNLPARYYDRVACYHTVYLTSNLDIYTLYVDVQSTEAAVWQAFLRRIKKVIYLDASGEHIMPI